MTATLARLHPADRERLILRLRELDDLDALLRERGQQRPALTTTAKPAPAGKADVTRR